MLKYGLIGCLALSIILFGLTLPGHPPDSYRDPVPSGQKVAHSNHCAGCHGYDEMAMALVDQAGQDVNIYDDWLISMMGLSAHDPFWRATLAHEVNLFPAAQADIETTCLKCHAPLGSIQAHFQGVEYSYQKMLTDSLGLDGVSCSACHQQPMQDLGKGHSGNFTMDTNRVFFGQFPNPFKGPMQIYVGFEPAFSDHIYESGVCSGCHTLITETLDVQGIPTGNYFVEQATYHEWLNSAYPSQGKPCQTCHLPFIPDEVVIATDFLALEGRQPFGLHQFFGANTAMLSLMKDHKKALDLPKASSDQAWTESIDNNRISLKNAADISIDPVVAFNDTLYAHLRIKNKAGHKLPSGYPSRVVWLQVVLLDHDTQDTLYANGMMDAQGHIVGRDFPFEPHHEIISSPEEVQIYELVMGDSQGQLTTRLNAAHHPLKDNRILPLGFRRDHSTYDTVAIWGNALLDSNYDATSHAGQDEIDYKIPLHGNPGFGDLYVSLHYQTLPSRWMQDIFTNDTLPAVSQFKSMYAAYTRFDEIIQSLSLTAIDLNTVATHSPVNTLNFTLIPNPVSGHVIYLNISDGTISPNLTYAVVTMDGQIVQQGKAASQIDLLPQLTPAAYYFMLYDNSHLAGYTRFVRL